MYQTTPTPASTESTTYIIKQNETLQSECRELRTKWQTDVRAHSGAIAILKQELADLEAESDRTDASLRYLRNLQRTLASLHHDSAKIAEGYRAMSAASHKTAEQLREAYLGMRLVFAMICAAHAVVVTMVLLSSSITDVLLIVITTTSGFALVGRGRVSAQFKATARSEASATLLTKVREYEAAVAGLPGIEELIDNV